MGRKLWSSEEATAAVDGRFAARPKGFFLDGVELVVEYVNTFFNPVSCCFLYKAKPPSYVPVHTCDAPRVSSYRM
jgi:hypothetical protein